MQMPQKKVKKGKKGRKLLPQPSFTIPGKPLLDKVLVLVGLILILNGAIILDSIYRKPVEIAKPINSLPKFKSYQLYANDIKKNPQRITIESVKIDSAIVPSEIVDGYWEVSENTASYAVGTAHPGAKGNVVVFAHAREGLFLSLKDVKFDDEIVIKTQGEEYKYKVIKITQVNPTELSIIAPTKDETLTLYTCEGIFDEKRLVVQAIRI